MTQLAQERKKGGDLSDPLIFHITGDDQKFQHCSESILKLL
jgi:hypothetical protein